MNLEPDRKVRAEFVDYFGRGNPYERPRSPLRISSYRVWDDTGRTPEFRDGGSGWHTEVTSRDWGIGQRHLVMRVRYLQVSV